MIVIHRTYLYGPCISFRIFPPVFRRYISRRTSTFTICGCGLARMERAISKLRWYIGSNIGLDRRMTDHQCPLTARGRRAAAAPPPLARTAPSTLWFVIQLWLVETAILATIARIRPSSTTACNKIHETVVTFMRGIGKKYCVNTFAIHERCRFYERASRTRRARNVPRIPLSCVFFVILSYTKHFLLRDTGVKITSFWNIKATSKWSISKISEKNTVKVTYSCFINNSGGSTKTSRSLISLKARSKQCLCLPLVMIITLFWFYSMLLRRNLLGEYLR